MVYLPLKLVTSVFPSVLPYSFNLATEMPLGEFSFELILLQVILPTVLEQSVAAQFLKSFVIQWCKIVGRILGLAEYLLPLNVLLDLPADAVVQNVIPPANVEADNDADDDTDDSDSYESGEEELQLAPPDPALGVAPLVAPALPLLQNNNHGDNFIKPSYFGIRILTLLFLLSVTGVLTSFALFVLPGKLFLYRFQ